MSHQRKFSFLRIASTSVTHWHLGITDNGSNHACRLFGLLRPGGRLLVTDYCTGEAPPSPGFQAYITQRGYKLVTLSAYSGFIRSAGFQDVIAEDRTAQVRYPSVCTAAHCIIRPDFCTLISIS